MIIAAHLEADVKSLIFVSLAGMPPVALHAPPMAAAFGDWLDCFVPNSKVIFINYRRCNVLRSFQEVIANICDLQIFDLTEEQIDEFQEKLWPVYPARLALMHTTRPIGITIGTEGPRG